MTKKNLLKDDIDNGIKRYNNNKLKFAVFKS